MKKGDPGLNTVVPDNPSARSLHAVLSTTKVLVSAVFLIGRTRCESRLPSHRPEPRLPHGSLGLRTSYRSTPNRTLQLKNVTATWKHCLATGTPFIVSITHREPEKHIPLTSFPRAFRRQKPCHVHRIRMRIRKERSQLRFILQEPRQRNSCSVCEQIQTTRTFR